MRTRPHYYSVLKDASLAIGVAVFDKDPERNGSVSAARQNWNLAAVLQGIEEPEAGPKCGLEPARSGGPIAQLARAFP
jgi:hypothetical protein